MPETSDVDGTARSARLLSYIAAGTVPEMLEPETPRDASVARSDSSSGSVPETAPPMVTSVRFPASPISGGSVPLSSERVLLS